MNLARAYALQNKVDKARTVYQNFFGRRKDADPDIPFLIAAKSEYESLHQAVALSPPKVEAAPPA